MTKDKPKIERLKLKIILSIIVFLCITIAVFPIVFYKLNGYSIIENLSHYNLTLIFYGFIFLPTFFFKSLLISAIISVVFLGGLYLFTLRTKNVNVHGNARFAKQSEIKDLIEAKEGIIIGKSDGKLLRFKGQQFVALGAPTRSGKGVGIVIPNLLEWQQSVIVLDIKRECYTITSKYRRDILKQKVFLFSPFQNDSSKYNPLDYVNFEEGKADMELSAIAGILYVSAKGDDFWTQQARELFVGMCLFTYDLIKANVIDMPFSLATVNEIAVTIKDKPFLEAYEQYKVNACAGARLRLDKYVVLAEQTMSGVKASFDVGLSIYGTQIVGKNTNSSDFLLTNLRKEKMTIYIGLSPSELTQGRALINLFFSQLIYENTKVLPENDGTLQFSCLLLLDEFPAIEQIDIIKKGSGFIAGYNLRLLTIFQSLSQLRENEPKGYGREGAKSLLTNHACQIIYSPKEEEDAKEYSERLGTLDLKSETRSRSNSGLMGTSGSISEAINKRALMLPQELKEMSFKDEIIFLEAHKPIKCEKAFYYNDNYFIDKLREVSPSLKKIANPTQKDFNKVYASGETCI